MSDRVEKGARRYVWAPSAAKVELLVDDRAAELQRDATGWWTGAVELLRAGDDYWFCVDGARLPDPRSPFQPQGVHGPSQHVDHGEFSWNDAGWQPRPLAAAIIYELHVGTFTPEGTLTAAIDRLPHLVRLGVTHVELMPVAAFPGDYGWGYDGVFPFAPHHAYGGPTALKQFVDACHTAGLAVLLDVVYNHLGPIGNYLPRFGPYFNERTATPWGAAVNFDGPDSDEVRRYFCDNALTWLRDYHFDGLRLDAVHAIVDRSATPFLEQLAGEVDDLEAAVGRHFTLIAESDLNDPRIVSPPEIGGFGLDAQWSDDVHHALHAVLTGERGGYYADFGSFEQLAAAMSGPYVYAGSRSGYRRRRHGRRPPNGTRGRRFVAFLQSHDQIGNRAQGERIGQLAGVERAKIGAALALLSPYVPMLFQGEEWNASSPFQFFVDFRTEPDLERAVTEGRRREFQAFGWRPDEVADPTDRRTFVRSKLKWEELDAPRHAEMCEWYRRLIRLRRSVSAVAIDRLEGIATAFDEAEQWLTIERGPLTIVCNLSRKSRRIPADGARLRRLLLSSQTLPAVAGGRDDGVELPAETVAVWTLDEAAEAPGPLR